MDPYRILLAEDHVLFRELIKKNLNDIAGLEVVGEVDNGLELLEALKTLTPDMIILDIGMPHLSGLEAVRVIKEAHPQIKLLLLTMYKSKEHLAQALGSKVDGYLLKENAFKDLITAIRMIRAGNFYISDIISKKIMDIYFHKTARGRTPRQPIILSEREIEVLKLFASGKPIKEIAELLFITHPTVRNHISNIKKKLSIKRTIDLIKYAIKEEFISIC